MTTIVLTVSRLDYLDRVITNIELLECAPYDTNILAIVDGDGELYVKTRNRIGGTKFINRLTVKHSMAGKPSRYNVEERRQRIAAAHNQAKALITHSDGFVFSVEDDTLFGSLALKKLMKIATTNRAAAIVEGVELGRWGVPYVGGWLADDIYDLKQLKSIANINPVPSGQEPSLVDATGLYCALIRADLYKGHTFMSGNGLGPDINFGIELRQQGFQNFIAWNVPCTHLNKVMDRELEISPRDDSKVVTLTKVSNNRWQASS